MYFSDKKEDFKSNKVKRKEKSLEGIKERRRKKNGRNKTKLWSKKWKKKWKKKLLYNRNEKVNNEENGWQSVNIEIKKGWSRRL